MDKKHIFRQLLNKAISMALWTKAITCDKAGFKSRFCQVHQADKIKIGVNRRNPRLINDLRSTKDYVRNYKKNMQNKPKFPKSQVNVTALIIKDYDKMDTWSIRKTKPIQSQLKPIQTQLKPIKCQNKPNSKPVQIQFLSAISVAGQDPAPATCKNKRLAGSSNCFYIKNLFCQWPKFSVILVHYWFLTI